MKIHNFMWVLLKDRIVQYYHYWNCWWQHLVPRLLNVSHYNTIFSLAVTTLTLWADYSRLGPLRTFFVFCETEGLEFPSKQFIHFWEQGVRYSRCLHIFIGVLYPQSPLPSAVWPLKTNCDVSESKFLIQTTSSALPALIKPWSILAEEILPASESKTFHIQWNGKSSPQQERPICMVKRSEITLTTDNKL